MVLEIPENEFINNSGHRYSVIAHEYFHVYQISLSTIFLLPSGDPDGFSIMLLAEGAAAAFESLYMRQYYDTDYFLEAQTRVDASVTANPAKFEVYVRDDNYSSSVFMTLVLAKEMEKSEHHQNWILGKYLENFGSLIRVIKIGEISLQPVSLEQLTSSIKLSALINLT